jgi:hypothetical protein
VYQFDHIPNFLLYQFNYLLWRDAKGGNTVKPAFMVSPDIEYAKYHGVPQQMNADAYIPFGIKFQGDGTPPFFPGNISGFPHKPPGHEVINDIGNSRPVKTCRLGDGNTGIVPPPIEQLYHQSAVQILNSLKISAVVIPHTQSLTVFVY